MGVYRGAILDLHKNRLKRRASARAAGAKEAGINRRAREKLDVKVAGQTVDVREDDGKYYVNNEEVTKDSYDSAVTRNRIAQQAQKRVGSGYGVDSKESSAPAQTTTPATSTTSVVPLQKPANTTVVKKDKEPIKKPPVQIDPSAMGTLAGPVGKGMTPDQEKDYYKSAAKMGQDYRRDPATAPPIKTRFDAQHSQRGALLHGKDPTKVAPQVMTDKPNIMQSAAARAGQMSSPLNNPNVGGMTIGQEPNTGVVNKQSFGPTIGAGKSIQKPSRQVDTLGRGSGSMSSNIPIPDQLKSVNPFRAKRGMFQGKGMDIAKPSHLQLAQGWGTHRTGGVVDPNQAPGKPTSEFVRLSKPGTQTDQQKMTEARKKVMSKFGKDVKTGASTAYDWMSKLNQWLGKNKRKNKPIY